MRRIAPLAALPLLLLLACGDDAVPSTDAGALDAGPAPDGGIDAGLFDAGSFDAGTTMCASPCPLCQRCRDGACVPVAEGSGCPGGRCWSGRCCRGCWAGDECRTGVTLAACGEDGAPCSTCGCDGDACTEGECVPAVIVSEVSAGGAHTCATLDDASVHCWGRNVRGQVGTGTFDVVRASPERVGGVDADLLSTGGQSTCLVGDDKRMRCWGAADRGQLATGDFAPDRSTPTLSPGAPDLSVLTLGTAFGCGLDGDGNLFCWGAAEAGQLGISLTSDVPAPSRVGSSTWLHVGAGDRHVCAVELGTGHLYCWGANERAQLGLGRRGITSGRNTPTLVENERSWSFVTAGDLHSCGLTDVDLLWCWGANDEGQLGSGDVIDRRWPSARGRGWIVVDAGARHTCGVTASQTILCWGNGGEGRLGTGDEARRIDPTIVAGAENDWRTVSAGGRHSCGVKRGGALYCWGSNADGQLGTGATGASPVPLRVCF